jgi:putative CocE/NonD family hydrolase
MQDIGAYDWPSIFPHLPIATSDKAARRINQPYREWLKHPRRNDPYWDDISHELEVHKAFIPILIIEGWYDIFLRGALQDDINIRTRSQSELARKGKRLIIRPWGHETGGRRNSPSSPDFGPEAEIDKLSLFVSWNDHWLKGIDNSVGTEPPIKIFVMGENYCRYENKWLIARTRYTEYCIQSRGRANSAAGDGTFGKEMSAGAVADHFICDPASPVPTMGGDLCCSAVPSGAHCQSEVEKRRDVLVYTTPALT